MLIAGPVSPMLAATVDRIPDGRMAFEPKWDGFRVQVRVGPDGRVELYSRALARLTALFPETAAAVGRLVPPGTVLDGELVRWAPTGRLDFEVLQQRLRGGTGRAAAQARERPVHVVVFDVLETAGEGDVRGLPLQQRRRILEGLFADAPPDGLVVLTPQTVDRGEAELWLEVLTSQGIEGLVIKPLDGAYLPGRRRWFKLKRRWTTLAVAGGFLGSFDAPTGLVIGRVFPDGRMRITGRTSAPAQPLRRGLAAELAARFPAPPEHPWPDRLAPNWHGEQPEPILYHRIRPDLVVEVSVDVATERDRRWRHLARLLDVRGDLDPADVPRGLDLE
ncbi:ATP-dependent DNA ligase [Actinomadura logoneensis]|uniref:ATP-dependent DNA ligase n=1 Tax=Actinomadura logoneensis TaxID=2293572 RepID=A0A372JNW7_9ACTN|nr:ATP-dependent DNA ligase [Actinomadura logoneensis]RFU41444.1 ATP-dependent DNA ligase [Actinomadura logoneensis]